MWTIGTSGTARRRALHPTRCNRRGTGINRAAPERVRLRLRAIAGVSDRRDNFTTLTAGFRPRLCYDVRVTVRARTNETKRPRGRLTDRGDNIGEPVAAT